MSLADKFKTLEPAQTGLPCGIAKVMEQMNDVDRDALTNVLFDQIVSGGKRVSNTKIYQILTGEGYDIALSSIAQHRRNQCRCFVGAAARKRDIK